MGFYGNISNVNKTNMTFDKIYSNRKSMDESCALDGVYTGRYVLVEYEQYYPLDTLPIIYKVSSNKEEKFSTTYTQLSPLEIQENVIYRCVILTNWLNSTISEEDLLLQYYSNVFYRGVQKDGVLSLENVSSEISEENYVGNFNIDRIEYNTSRGYDSTVWMKQYDSNGIPRYVNIAELNSVVPTFDVSVDAPTMEPQSPHFDADSTNIYYNLHVQPQWGFRVKEAARKNANGGIISDATTKYTSITYDENGAEIITSTDVDADIYFNKAGFDKNNRKAYVDLEIVGEDSIDITPTGVSGQLYNNHEKGQPKKEAPDIQELSINLPSVGNMMSEAWDYIYGPERDSYMGQWKTKEDLVDESIFTNNAIDNEGYILEGGERKDFSSFDGRLKSISLCEGETIPVKKSSDGSIIGASINKEKADDWIATAIDSEKSNITIKHKTKFEQEQNNSREAQSPLFGSSFDIPAVMIDEAGHVSSFEKSSTVILPSFTQGETDSMSSNVAQPIVQINLNDTETGKEIKAYTQNVGSLKLTGYTEISNDGSVHIQTSDSINSAFKKLEDKLNGIAAGAEVNANADWNATEGDALILNKPTLGALAAKDSLTAEDVGALPADTPIPTVPTLISAFENDKGYLTEHQSLDGYAKTADIPNIVLNISDFITLQNKVKELEERIAQLENPTTTE